MGAKKKPFYRIVVADSRSARDGRFIEQIGYFDPTVDPPKVSVDAEKANLWLSRGAQPTDVVRSILSKVLGGVETEVVPAAEEKPKRARRKKEEPEPAAAAEETKAVEPETAAETKPAEPEAASEEAKDSEPETAAEETEAESASTESEAEAQAEETPAEE